MESKKTTHPSFGILSISRGHYGKGLSNIDKITLFGSSILHTSFILMEVHRASLLRTIHHDSVFPEGMPIVSFYMSPSQFADAITSLNTVGTPCTISFVDGHPVEPPPYESKRVQFDEEFEEKMEEIVSDTNEYYTKIKEILDKPNIGKHDREEILHQLRLLNQQIASNVPFIKTSFTEQMDQTVVEIKNEFNAFVEGRLKSLGLENLKDKLSLDYMSENKKEKEE
jgi:hypothetical protein